MKIKGFHVGIIAAAALLSLVLFFVGQSLYQRHFVLNPILKELGAIKGVEGVQVLPAGEESLCLPAGGWCGFGQGLW